MEKVAEKQGKSEEISNSENRYKMESTDSDLSEWESRTFGNIHLKSPPLVHQDDDSSNSDNPHLSPSKRRYPNSFGNSADSESPKKSMDSFRFDKENIPTNWSSSLTSRDRDSALGGSLISAYGSVLTDSSSSFDAQSNSESETVSNLSSPTHSTYGRYRKIYGNRSESTENDKSFDCDQEEVVVLHRLPGENLGMILGIEGDKTKEHISAVRVKTVTIGGAAYRATGSSSGIAVGDEVLQVNGLDLKTLSHDECVTVFKEMPLRVILKIKRKFKQTKSSETGSQSSEGKGSKNSFVMRYSASESEDDNHDGFVPLQCEIDKDPTESLGLSIVPSYGSTRQYFQIKRLLPSGAAARSRKLKVGDRLVSCNGIHLRGINQSKCLSVLKSEANNGDFEIEILRPVENGIPTEFSLTVSNGHSGETNLILKSPRHSRKTEKTPFDSESEPEIVLNSFQNSTNSFTSNSVKLPSDKSDQETIYTSDASTDLESSFEQDLNRRRNTHSTMASEEQWGFALPPPMEFSDSPDNGQVEEEIPVTSIDDVLNEYSPSCSNMSTPIHQPTPPQDMKMIEALVGLEDETDVSAEFPLTNIEESPLEQVNNINGDQLIENGDSTEHPSEVEDNYLDLQKEDKQTNYLNTNGDLLNGQQNNQDKEDQVDSKQEKNKSERKTKNFFNLVGNIHQFYYNSSDALSQSESGDDDLIQPVRIKKDLVVPDYIKEHSKIVKEVVEEEAIAPSAIERSNKIPISATFDVNSFTEVKKEDIPHPMKSDSPPLPEIKKNKSPKPRAPTEVEFKGEEIVETFTPVLAQRENYSKLLEEKLSRGIEEESIVASEVKRDDSFGDKVQLLMMTNRWASSAKEKSDKKSTDITFSGMVQHLQNVEPDIDSSVTVNNQDVYVEKVELPAKEEDQELSKLDVTPTESSINKHDKSVENQPENSIKQSNKEPGEHITEISITTKNKSETDKISKAENIADAQVDKTITDVTPVHKTTVAVTSSQSILKTVQAKTTTSSIIKPLSTIKPLSFSTSSLNRPSAGRYSTTINTGSKPSLLSTIYSKTHAVAANVRTEDQEFLVSVMKGILGIGMKAEVRPEGYVQVTEIQSNGPVGKDGNIRVGDYILSINSTELTGLPDHKVQQIIRLLPRGLAKIVVSVSPPDITKIDTSKSLSRPPDLSINTSSSALRRLSPALSPKMMMSEANTTSPRSSYTSPTVKPLSPTVKPASPTMTKPISPALSPSHHHTSPTSQHSPNTAPRSPGLAPALAPRKSSLQQTPPKPVAIPRQTVTHDASQKKPVEDTMSSDSVTSTRKEPPPIAPKPKPRSLPQQTETATHHKITPNLGGYVGSAVGQLKKSHEPVSVDREPVITAHHTDYVSSARKASHDTEDNKPIDTVIFASINPGRKTDYVSSARKTFDEPKLIPSGMVDYVPTEKPKAAERTKPSHFQVLAPSGGSEGGVKITGTRLNSALSPRKGRSENKTAFNFNNKFSSEDKALPRAGYFVGKTDVVTSPKDVESLHDEDVSVPPVPSPRADNSLSPTALSPRSDTSMSSNDGSQKSPIASPRSPKSNSPSSSPRFNLSLKDDSQIDVVACSLEDDMSSSQENRTSLRLESTSTVPSVKSGQEFEINSENVLEAENKEKPEYNFSDKLPSNANKLLSNDACGVVHEAEIVSDFTINQEPMPENDILTHNIQTEKHGESDNIFMHDKISEQNPSSDITNTLNIDINKNDDFATREITPVNSFVKQGTEETGNIQNDLDPCMNLPKHVESQAACTNVVMETEDISGESSNTEGGSENQNITVQLISDSENVSFLQESHGSEDQPTGAILGDNSNINVDKTYSNINQDIIDNIVVESVPPGFSDEIDSVTNNDIHHLDQSNLTDVSVPLTQSSAENFILDVSFPSYCVKFPLISGSDSDLIVVSSQRPFSIICGEQKVSVKSKSNCLEDIVLCELLVSTQMLSNDLKLANQKMDSIGRSNNEEISVILLHRQSSRTPIGINLSSGPYEDMVVSQLDPSGLFQQSGHIKTGDTILLINGEIVSKDNADAILESLENSESHLVCVVISYSTSLQSKGDNSVPTPVTNLPHSPTSDENANKKIIPDTVEPIPDTVEPNADGLLELTMVKGVTGLGFLIEGGIGSPRGDVPVKIKRMFKGGSAAKCGVLKVGDELVTVAGVEMSTMRHTEAWNFLKFLDDGEVKLTVRRALE
ncbi:uncharacterized protein [Mytilus edulis]